MKAIVGILAAFFLFPLTIFSQVSITTAGPAGVYTQNLVYAAHCNVLRVLARPGANEDGAQPGGGHQRQGDRTGLGDDRQRAGHEHRRLVRDSRDVGIERRAEADIVQK